MDHLITQYRHWNTGDEVSERNEETRFIVDLCEFHHVGYFDDTVFENASLYHGSLFMLGNRNGVGDNEMQQLRETVQNLEIQLNDPKELAEIEAAKVLIA